MIRQPSPIDIGIGAAIRQRRVIVGMSQSDLGDACGITFQQIQKYEKGLNRVGGSRLMQIAEALGVQPASLLPATEAPEAELMIKDAASAQLIRAFNRIANSAMRRSIVDMAEAAAQSA